VCKACEGHRENAHPNARSGLLFDSDRLLDQFPDGMENRGIRRTGDKTPRLRIETIARTNGSATRGRGDILLERTLSLTAQSNLGFSVLILLGSVLGGNRRVVVGEQFPALGAEESIVGKS
jgi:hypothetical protein